MNPFERIFSHRLLHLWGYPRDRKQARRNYAMDLLGPQSFRNAVHEGRPAIELAQSRQRQKTSVDWPDNRLQKLQFKFFTRAALSTPRKTINGAPIKTRGIDSVGHWRNFATFEYATLKWIHWLITGCSSELILSIAFSELKKGSYADHSDSQPQSFPANLALLPLSSCCDLGQSYENDAVESQRLVLEGE